MKKHITIGIMMSLLSGKKMTANDLAIKFETSKKSIYRAIETLIESGIPISSIQGKNGGYELINFSNINSTFFTIDELCAFLSFIKTNNLKLIANQNKSIQERLNLIKDKSIKNKLQHQSQFFIFDATQWGQKEIDENKIIEICECINQNKKIMLTYQNSFSSIESKRIIHPYSIVLKSNINYLYAFCEKRNNFRLFKFSRIKSIEDINQNFIRKEIDIQNMPWNEDFKNNFEQIEIELECDNLIINDISQWLFDPKIIFKENNKTIIKANANYTSLLVHKIMEFGNKIKILKPEKLSNDILNECKEIYCNYK